MFGKVFVVVLSSIANASNDAKCVLSSNARFNLPLLIYILMSTVKNFITIHFRLNQIDVLEAVRPLMTYQIKYAFQIKQKI